MRRAGGKAPNAILPNSKTSYNSSPRTIARTARDMQRISIPEIPRSASSVDTVILRLWTRVRARTRARGMVSTTLMASRSRRSIPRLPLAINRSSTTLDSLSLCLLTSSEGAVTRGLSRKIPRQSQRIDRPPSLLIDMFLSNPLSLVQDSTHQMLK
ncbi:hypothetical protein BCR34DRAFT_664755, partial [Clohesyomyces aquaticus]